MKTKIKGTSEIILKESIKLIRMGGYNNLKYSYLSKIMNMPIRSLAYHYKNKIELSNSIVDYILHVNNNKLSGNDKFGDVLLLMLIYFKDKDDKISKKIKKYICLIYGSGEIEISSGEACDKLFFIDAGARNIMRKTISNSIISV